MTFDNTLHGSSYGAEATVDTRPASWWRIVGSYSHLRVEMTRDPGSMDVSQERRYEGLVPAHMGHLQSSFDLPAGLTADWLWRGIARLPAGPVPAYHTSNVRVGWMATRQMSSPSSGGTCITAGIRSGSRRACASSAAYTCSSPGTGDARSAACVAGWRGFCSADD